MFSRFPGLYPPRVRTIPPSPGVTIKECLQTEPISPGSGGGELKSALVESH